MTVAAPSLDLRSIMAALTMPTSVRGAVPHRKKWNREQFHALGDLGVFEGLRPMLIDGEIWEQGPMDPPHAYGIQLGMRALMRVFHTGFDVRSQLPFNVGQRTDPLPDFAVVKGEPKDFLAAHPSEAVLVMEVSDTTLNFDLTEKAELYAEAGIPEYWVTDMKTKRLHVLRNPGSLAPGGFAFADQRVLVPGDSISPLAAPNATVNVADLF